MIQERHNNQEGDAGADCVYVLGSGASLLDLAQAERAYLCSRPTIAMNKYMLFWDKIGVFPTHYFLADVHNPAPHVLAETRAIVQRAGRPMHYLLDSGYAPRCEGDGLPGGSSGRPPGGHAAARTCEQTAGRSAPLERFTFFRRPHRWNAPQHWARSLDEEMFFHRGSLTVLLNLIAVLRIAPRIKLLGVDLNTNAHFFDEELRRRPDLHDQWIRRTLNDPESGHVTAVPLNGMPGIQARWPFIMERLARDGIECVCCNPESLLVEQGLCAYAPVIERVSASTRTTDHGGSAAEASRTQTACGYNTQHPALETGT